MIFKCKNCSGNTVYSPARKKMYCPFCESEESHEKSSSRQLTTACSNCGGELQLDDFTSASRCPYCDSYIIFDERVEGEYEPQLMLPFVVDRENAKQKMRTKFRSNIFAPSDFFSEVRMNDTKYMKGMYVPFWMYDYHAESRYEGEGKKVRVWVSGNRQYTETSIFRIAREMTTEFEKVPVDASAGMPDGTMDLLEPYPYGALEAFHAEYLSGFFAEKYNQDADTLEGRSKTKTQEDAHVLLHRTLSGYTSLRSTIDSSSIHRKAVNYALLPVWIYQYKYKEKDYVFHVNGQTGKIIGELPILPGKVLGYSATVFGALFAFMLMLRHILNLF